MKTKIAPYKSGNRTVLVTFEYRGVTHVRRVPAAFDEKGAYDKATTAETVEQVASGVAHKISQGFITNETPRATPEEEDAQA